MLLKDAIVLLVDDEVDLLKVFRRWLEREGCRVLTAENGQQGLDVAASEPIDLIISDIRMPVMDGIEMVQRLNADGLCGAKVAFLSGFSEISNRDCYDLGVQAALNKPIGRAQVLAAATRCLMGRNEAWSLPPPAAPMQSLAARFASVADARREGHVAFGHGGFCLRSTVAVRAKDTIGFELGFTTDPHSLRGAGVVRWIEPVEGLIGIEITYVDDDNRAWAAALPGESGTTAFIPRTSHIKAPLTTNRWLRRPSGPARGAVGAGRRAPGAPPLFVVK